MRLKLTINWRFLLISVGVLAVVAVGVHFLHRWQVQQQTGAFLRQADAAAEAKDTRLEIQHLRRYLISNPNDLEAQVRLVKLVVATARTRAELQEAYLAIENVLQRDPSRTELRRSAFELAVKLRELTQARSHLAALLKANPNDGELEERMAYLYGVERNYAVAAEWYKKAYGHKPDLFAAYSGHALLLRETLNDAKGADEAIDALLKANAGSYKAHLLNAEYGRKYGKPDRAKAGLAKARELAPDELDVILSAVADARTAVATATSKAERDARLADARAEITRGLGVHPKAVPLLLARGEVEHDAGGPAAAVQALVAATAAVPDQPALLLPLAGYQSDASDPAAATATLDQLQKLNASGPQIEYQRARVVMLRGGWAEAVKGLLAVRRSAVGDAPLAHRASLLLGRCYEQLGEPDRQLEAYTQAVPDSVTDPLWPLAVAGQASAYAALGRRADALAAHTRAADRLVGGWVPVARLRILNALDRKPADRDWADAEQAVNKAVERQPDATEVKLVQADLLALRGKPAEAKAIVDALFQERPKEPAVWVAKAAADARDGTPADGVKRLRQGREELNDPVELRLAEARGIDPADADGGKKLLALADGADKYPPAARRQLLRGLAAAAAGGPAAAALWDAVVRVQPDDLTAHLTRFDLALASNDGAAVDALEAEIRRIDGDTGSSARMAKALRLLWRAKQLKETGGLDEAVALFEGLEKDRGRWPRVTLGKALSLDLQGKSGAALPLYQRAVSDGESSPEVLRRLVLLLAQSGKYADANAVLVKLPDDALATADARRLAAEVSLRADAPKRAVELAGRAVPADSTDANDHLWLGRVRAAGGDPDGAEKAYRRAVELKPADPDHRLVLVDHLLAAGRRDAADKAFNDGAGAVSAEARRLYTARGLALLGRPDDAAKAFQQARAEQPSDLVVARSEAEFLAAVGRLEAARGAWDQVLKHPSASADERQTARQSLALCYAFDPDYAVAVKAAEVLGVDATGRAEGPATTPAERRTRAVVLAARRDRAGILAAIRLLSEGGEALDASDRFLLATLCQRVNDAAGVRKAMASALSVAPRQPLLLAFYALWLVEQDNPRDAEGYAARLEREQPEAVVTAEVRARVSAANGDTATARAALKAAADRPGSPLDRLAAVAERCGLAAEAEGLFKRVADANKSGAGSFPLAGFYARNGRLADALALIEPAWKGGLPATDVGQQSLDALAAGKPSEADVRKVSGWVEGALKTADDLSAPTLAMQLAGVRNLQGRYDEAAAIYEGLLKGKQPNPLALNNLAYLRSYHDQKHAEALELVRAAKKMAGPLPEFLDTEALVLLNRNRGDDATVARDLLLDVVALAPNGAGYFHLALAEEKLKNTLAAKAAVADARRRKVKAADLHPLEAADFNRLFP